MEEQQKKNKIISVATSLGLHALLLLVFLFMMSLRPPYPPAPEYGIELNFGLDDSGYGEIQPEVPVGTKEETQEEDQVTTQAEATSQPEQKEEVIKETLTSDDESSVAVKEEKKEIKKTEPTKVIKDKPTEVKPQPNVVETKKEPVLDAKALYSKEGTPGNHGDDKGKVGDNGNTEGSLDANALYGKPGGGGGGGFALNMSGWSWDENPKSPKLPDNENGRVVFEITVDEDGEIVKIETRERSLSPAAEKICKDEILKRSLLKTSNGQAPPFSKGRITFVLRTQ